MKLGCPFVKPWLGDYADGALTGRRLRRVERHLARCAACQEAAAGAQAALRRLDAAPEPIVDVAAAYARFRIRLATAAPAAPAAFWHRAWPFALGAGALCGAALVLWLSLGGPSEPAPPAGAPPPFAGPEPAAPGEVPDELLADLDLLADLPLIENLDAVENLEAVLALVEDPAELEDGHEG